MRQTTYFGIPTQKHPLDFWVYQEIICATLPDVIIELGNFRGGSTLALAHICDSLGRGRVIAVDRDHDGIDPLAERHGRITFVTGDACRMFAQVRHLAGGATLIIDDTSHTFDNTLRVLEAYSVLVKPGGYFVVEDSICHHGLDIGPKPGPYEAAETFVRHNKSFEIDRSRESFLLTWNPKGYIRRRR